MQRAAIYARYSSDRQRESSIADQVRNCRQFAEREKLSVEHIYQDHAISGAVTARSGYQDMLAAATAGRFDVLIVDDLSRLSRDEIELKRVLRKFTFQGLRVVGVLDGYDSSRKGHKLQASIYGIKNEIYLDDLREKTHSGMKGRAEAGFNCGGRTYGYRNVPIEDEHRKDAYGRPAIIAMRYELDADQAEVVRHMHAWYAEGRSYKWIACELNRQRVPASRGGTWAISAVKCVLENKMYEGRLTWNKRVWVKHPDTGRRTYRERPESDWITRDDPSLRIVAPDIIAEVRRRQRDNAQRCAATFPPSSAQKYLFSGLMRCAQCGANFVMSASGRYGCAAHKTRGPATCDNSITVSRRIVEDRLLAEIKTRLLAPGNITKFRRAAESLLKSAFDQDQHASLAGRLKAAERIRSNLLEAIKQGIITASTKFALETAEQEISTLERQREQLGQWEVSEILPRAVERYQQAVSQLAATLDQRVDSAREILKSLIGDRIRIHRRDGYLEAEIPNSASVIMAKALNSQFDSFGCGGAICTESTFVSLEPRLADSIPLRYRARNSAVVSRSA